MYLHFYNLKREPFNITPDPDLLFLSPSHKEALAAVICGVNRRKGFVAIIGEVGVGKTTIIRSFLDRINYTAQTDNQTVKTIYIFNPNISFKGLLKTIYHNLGETPKTDDIYTMIDELHMLLIQEYKAGNNVVLIIDEAQNMPVETLENLRMLSNLETASDKLIQVVMCGQPEFEDKLNLHELRQLKQRIAIRVRILPLSKTESFDYVQHRLTRTVTKDPELFTQAALNLIVKEAGGIPRNINILCDNCLVTSFGNQQKKVTVKVAKEIIADHRMEKKSALLTRQVAVLVCLVVILIAVVGYAINLSGGFEKSKPRENIKTEKSSFTPQKTALPETVNRVSVETLPVAEKAVAADTTKDGSDFRYRTIKRGDTFAGVIRDTYGTVDKGLFNKVMRQNPHISDVNRIQVGEKIYFPQTSKQ